MWKIQRKENTKAKVDLKDEFYVKYMESIKEGRVRLYKETMTKKGREKEKMFFFNSETVMETVATV